MAVPTTAHPHFHRPVERPFLAAERASVTVLFGGLTATHDRLIRAVLEGAGYRAERVPTPDLGACHLGRYFGNVGQCNPAYFTIGALIQFLRNLEAQGLSRQEILDRYVFFTAGSCGPCRFGMYEAEYRLALENAGFGGFRVLVFNQGAGVRTSTGEPGLTFSLDLGLGALNAFLAGDVANDLACRIRPYETSDGATDRVIRQAVDRLGTRLRDRPRGELSWQLPGWLARALERTPRVSRPLRIAGQIHDHLHGPASRTMWDEFRSDLAAIEVDWLQPKPVVQVAGEFWAHTTEGDGNFRMFEFLEREGAEVRTDSVASWIAYLLWFAQHTRGRRHRLGPERPPARRIGTRVRYEWRHHRTQLLFWLARTRLDRHYRRLAMALGGLEQSLPDLDELAELARDDYDPLLGGGEGHLEVAKLLHCSRHRTAHLVLSLKPFGCLPSTQSDGVQAAVLGRCPNAEFLPVETSGDGAIHAYSRVQMALAEARARALAEFDGALADAGRSLEEVRAFVGRHPGLQRACPPVPRRAGVAGTAANLVLHVGDLMRGARAVRPAGTAARVGG